MIKKQEKKLRIFQKKKKRLQKKKEKKTHLVEFRESAVVYCRGSNFFRPDQWR